MASKFSVRSNEIEIMDDLLSGGEVMDQTLVELEVINRLLGGNSVTINGLNSLMKESRVKEKIRIVDIGCGGGDMLKLVSQWAHSKGIVVELMGIDANPNVVQFAMDNCKGFDNISFKCMNIFSEDFKSLEYDVLIATLFIHHFSEEELTKLFVEVKRSARIGIVINDLHRHWFAYYSIKMLTGLFSRSPMVRNDAAVSVLRAFSRDDLKRVLKKAHIQNFNLKWMWAFRWQLIAKF